ncbi:hypothetical protein PPC_5315 [Pseudomonas protegens Cab57]|nr:hypothetical protein PPC_5315 [Pseudomonas protegens Cab57]
MAETIVPAFGILRVLEVARYVLAKLSAHGACRLAAADAAGIEAIGKGRRIALRQQMLMG